MVFSRINLTPYKFNHFEATWSLGPLEWMIPKGVLVQGWIWFLLAEL
jgi:hypothetical protein